VIDRSVDNARRAADLYVLDIQQFGRGDAPDEGDLCPPAEGGRYRSSRVTIGSRAVLASYRHVRPLPAVPRRVPKRAAPRADR